jgi:hypothetical protein
LKKLGECLMAIPFIWYFSLLTYYYFFTPAGNFMDVNPILFLKIVFTILLIPMTWIFIVLGIIGYLLYDRAERKEKSQEV